MELVIATHNRHKIDEISEMLSILSSKVPFTICSLADFPDYRLPEETGSSFLENATLKAVDAASRLNRWALSDDSGLVVPCLGGAPGVYSARYSRAGASDEENRAYLLAQMSHLLLPHEREAHLVCQMVLASPKGVFASSQGILEGRLLEAPEGDHGFGYDPLFQPLSIQKSLSTLTILEKNRLSHRFKALSALWPALEKSLFF